MYAYVRSLNTFGGNNLRATVALLGLLSTAGPTVRAEVRSEYLADGVSLLRQGSTFASIRAFRRALASGDARAHLPLAEAYFLLNQHKFFEEEIAQAKSSRPSDAEPYYVAGRYLFQTTSRFDDASREFEQALLRDPNHIKARCYLGISLKNTQKTAEAETQLLKAVELLEAAKSSFYLPYQTIASLYLEMGREDEAAAAIKKAVAMAPNVALNQFLLGKIAWTQKNGPAAIASLRTAISLDEAFLEAHYLLARILETQGDSAGASQQIAEFKALKEVYGVGRLP